MQKISPPHSPVLSTVRIRRYAAMLALLWTAALLCFFLWWHHEETEKIHAISRAEAHTAFQKDYPLQDALRKETAGLLPALVCIWGIGLGLIGLGMRSLTRNTAALEAGEEKYRALVNNVSEVIFQTDAEGNWLFLNPAWTEITGFTVDESIGNDSGSYLHPEDRFSCREEFRSLIGQGKEYCQRELRFLTKEGEARWLEAHARAAVDQAGNITGIAGTLIDVTERKKAEEALKESKEHVRQFFDQTSDGIVLFRMDTFQIIDANPAALEFFGAVREELARLKLWTFVKPQVYRDFIRAIPLDDDSREFQLDKANCFKKDGTKIVVAIRGKILKLKDQYVIFCSIRDISEKIRLEGEVRATQAKLIQANKMTSLGMLVSSISHEINNPNNYISVNASMLADVWRDTTPILSRFHAENGDFPLGGLPFTEMQELAPRLFTGITEGSRRIHTIVKEMRDFVKEDKSGLKGMMDVNRLVRNAASILWHHIHKHTGSFRLELQEGLPQVRGNGQQIEQVIINLMTNALQALPDKAAGVLVTTFSEPDRGEIIITVRDEGKGMSRKVQERLKEPFFTTKMSEGGTGLGLYISDSIIKEHKGAMEFESRLRSGTMVTVRLPRGDAPV